MNQFILKTVILSMITKLIVMSKSNIPVQVDNKRLFLKLLLSILAGGLIRLIMF